MDRETVQALVFDYFQSKASLPTVAPGETLAINYLDQKLIDSMGIVELITDFETQFGIQFTAEDLQAPEFQTIGGLVDIVNKRVNGK